MNAYEVHKATKDLLMETFSEASCSSCGSYPRKKDDELCKCATCDRKHIKWSLAEGWASIIADRILDIK
jgi:hypothetical protein